MIRQTILSLSIILLQTLMPQAASAQDNLTPDNDVVQRISQLARYISPQKVYMHLNKSRYHAGDAIWMKAYLFNGIDHTIDTVAANLYVDLVNSSGTIMERRILLSENGFAEGDITLSQNFPDGNYILRAYTNWMRNFGEEFYFTKYLYIENRSYANVIPRSEIRSNKRFNDEYEEKGENETIMFFPEGGQLVEGIPGRVAFKAMDGLGQGLEAEGEILNESSEVVASFATLHGGMGSFELNPAAGSVFTARVSFNGGKSTTFALPEVQKSGTVLRVEQDRDNILLDVASTASYDEIVVVAHTRGNVLHGETLPLQEGKGSLVIASEKFPSGIAHITVFSNDLAPLAERLAFINHDDAFVFYPEVSRQNMAEKEFYVLNMKVADKNDEPVQGNFSVSVILTDEISGVKDNIVSELLLTSDLKGIVEDAPVYFDQSQNLSASLDHLMMTHGWRRFSLESALSGEAPEIEYIPLSSLTVSGSVLHPSNKQYLPNFPVDLTIYGQKEENFSTNTDNKGRFLFDNLKFYDNVRIKLSTERLVSNTPPDIEFNPGEIHGINYTQNLHTQPNLITKRGNDWERSAEAGVSPYEQTTTDDTAPQQYGTPDQTVYIESDSKQSNMYDILITRIRGLNHNLQFRGPTSMTLSNTPLFIMDGVEVNQGAFLSADPRYVERIEVFSGSRAAVFGVRGATGAILGYSRRAGSFGPSEFEEYLIQGYHSPREFYPDLVPFTPAESRGSVERSIYWESTIITDESGNANVAIPVVTAPGLIKFVIEGAGLDGGVGYGIFSLQSAQ